MEQIILNLVPGGVSPVCYVSQYDVGRKIRLHLRNGSDPYVLSGAETINATIRKVSGEELIYDIANTSASYVDLIVNYDATDVIGESVCELIITESGLRIGSANFKMRVDPDVYSGDQKLEVVTASSPDSLLSFETNIDENLLELKTTFEPKQDLHGYPSPWIDSNEINKVPYIKRAVAGTATRIGNHLYDKLVGGTVAWNQLLGKQNASISANGISISFDATTKETTVIVENPTGYARLALSDGIIKAGHKYLLYSNDALAGASSGWGMEFYANNVSVRGNFENPKNKYVIAQLLSDGAVYFYVPQQVANGTYKYKLMCIDLTAMFGSTIADYIYSLEQATAGEGVAWFKALFPNDYYAYNAGELMSVKATAHVMKNASNQVIGNYALDSNLVLNGLFKLDANNKLYADGDTYESSGAITRKYGIVDLGSLNYTNMETSDKGFYTDVQTMKNNIVCAKYSVVNGSDIYNGTANDKTIGLTGSGTAYCIRIKDTSFTANTAGANALKASLSGVYLIYELATPTTEQASPFTNPQVCDENGTEEYTDNRAVAIPVGHETYQANICEITGFDELNVVRTGVNLWDEQWEVGSINHITGEPFNDPARIRSKNYSHIKGGVEIYTIDPTNNYNIRLFYYDVDKNYIGASIWLGNQTSTTPEGACYFKFIMGTQYGRTYNNDISINYPATYTTYHAYNGNVYTIAFGQTVYGGVLDVTRGKLHVTWGKKVYDGSDDENWSDYYSLYDGCSIVNYEMKVNSLNPSTQLKGNIAKTNTNRGNATSLSGVILKTYSSVNDSAYFFICGTGATSEAELRTFLASNPLEIAYELATPFDIDLTPVQISAIVGINNLMHDTNGGTEVKFFRLISAS